MKKDPDHNSTDSAEIEALITRLDRGQRVLAAAGLEKGKKCPFALASERRAA